MNVKSLIKSVYLGDRYCTKIIFDGEKDQVEVHVNLISRVRSTSGEWNFYSDEDIENGAIVFEGIKDINMGNMCMIPNDQIYNIDVKGMENGLFEVVIETSHVDKDANTHDLSMRLIVENAYLYNPALPKVKIVE